MTCVLLMSDVAVPAALDRSGLLRQTPAPTGTDGRAALVAAVRDDLDRHGAMLVLYPARYCADAERTVGLLRSSLRTSRVVGVPVDLPPLALGVLAAALSAVADQAREPGPLLAGLPVLARHLFVGAWVSRPDAASSMPGPASADRPDLATRAAALLPWSRFLVTCLPEHRAVRSGSHDGTAQPGWHRQDLRVVVLSGSDRDLRRAGPHVLAAMGWAGDDGPGATTGALLTVAATPHARRWWRTRRLVEVVTYPAGLPELTRAVWTSFGGAPCSWCGEPVSDTPCPMCGMARPGPRPSSDRPARADQTDDLTIRLQSARDRVPLPSGADR